MLRARFLGTPHVDLGKDSQGMILNGRILALFAYLAVTRQPQNRCTLTNLLWDSLSEQEAKTNLRYQLRDLRKAIGDYLVVDGQTVTLNQELPQWFDVISFMTYLSPANYPDQANYLSVAETFKMAQAEPVAFQELLNLYTGEFLAGFHIQGASVFEQWLSTQRRYMHGILIYGLQLATQCHLNAGEFESGLALNRYLLTLEPWREEIHRQRMLLLAASGQRSAALMQYEICCQTLEEELDVPPMTETTSLYTQIKSGLWFLDQQTPTEHSHQNVAVLAYPSPSQAWDKAMSDPIKAATRTTLPTHVDLGAMPSVDYLVGRQSELATLNHWFNDERCQFAAILGLAGQGKSTLAARIVQEQYEQGKNGQEEEGLNQRQQNPIVNQHAVQMEPSPSPLPKNQKKQAATTPLFAHIIWRTASQKSSCIALLQNWIQQLDNNPAATLPPNFDQLVTTLFGILEQKRCLLVLDGVEAVLHCSTPEEQAEADAYEQLFRLFIERQHRSCLLLTSRVRPMALTHLHKRKKQIYSLELTGLTRKTSGKLLAIHGIKADVPIQQQLHEHYSGNPRLLSQAADLIHNLFEGDASAFAQEDIYFLGDIGATCAEQLAHLSSLELQLLLRLVAAKQSFSRQMLWEELPTTIAKQEFYYALGNLCRAHLILQEEGKFKPASLPTAYLAEQLWEKEYIPDSVDSWENEINRMNLY